MNLFLLLKLPCLPQAATVDSRLGLGRIDPIISSHNQTIYAEILTSKGAPPLRRVSCMVMESHDGVSLLNRVVSGAPGAMKERARTTWEGSPSL